MPGTPRVAKGVRSWCFLSAVTFRALFEFSGDDWYGSSAPCKALCGTVGQLPHVLAEGLRGELQPLHHRQIREELIAEFFHRHPCMNRERGRLDKLTGVRRHRLHPDQPP